MVAGVAKLAKGAGLKILSRRSSRVRIPYPALNFLYDTDFGIDCLSNTQMLASGIRESVSNLGIELDSSSTIFMRRRLGCLICLQEHRDSLNSSACNVIADVREINDSCNIHSKGSSSEASGRG